MERLGNWFLGIAAAGLIGTVAQAFTPEQGQRQVRLASGILVVLAVLLPLRHAEGLDLRRAVSGIEASVSAKIEDLTSSVEGDTEELVRKQAENYICQLAVANGGRVDAEIRLSTDPTGNRILYSVTVRYAEGGTEEMEQLLREAILDNLGIPDSRQRHIR